MRRINPEKEIMYISNVIEKNIEANKILKDRGLLSQNILSQLRNLVEDIAILINNRENSLNNDIHYDNVNPSMNYICSKSKYKYLYKFHKYLQSTASHYTPNEEDAERLVLYYFRYMCMMKNTLNDFDICIFNNLDDFPIYEDNLSKEHYNLIANKIEEVQLKTNNKFINGRFYIQKIRPIYANQNIYYEFTLSKANDYINKFEHITMYSKIYIPDNYSIKISYIQKEIDILSTKTKIKIIDNFMISVRPCELSNIGKIINLNLKITDDYTEYINLMKYLTNNETTLLEELLKNKNEFSLFIQEIKEHAKNNNLSNLLLQLHKIIIQEIPGCNILKYFLSKIDNILIKNQLQGNLRKGYTPNTNLSNMCLKNKSIPFDSMPFAMSLSGYNISWKHLIETIDMKNREHELLARHVKYNCENNNILYTPTKELQQYGDIEKLIEEYNRLLIKYKIDLSGKNKLVLEHDYVYINSYEKDSIEIVKKLKQYMISTANNIISDLDNNIYNYPIMDLSNDKIEILKLMLRNNSIAIIHGPAGTGKTKMLEVLSEIFKDYSKIFLAHTNTAKNSLEKRISTIDINNSTFQTVYNYIENNSNSYDILFIDECSAVSNKDMYDILYKQNYKLIILSGDIYQIESIKYGNWFSLSYSYFKDDFVYDLANTHRTKDSDLLELWSLIRENDEQAITKMNNMEYSHKIDESIFTSKDEDEIVLCLNYDGLYGINNINKILQEKNIGTEYNIGLDTFKINDPIVFNDCPRFNKILYNNTKGIIKNIEIDDNNDCVWFTILINEKIYDIFNQCPDLEFIECEDMSKTIVKFYVNRFKDTNDDDNGFEHIIPFNLSYAISIHKAQGLEYNSVKIIITSNIEDNITKNIFYTAITRAKKHLTIYWSPDSQNKILQNFKKKENSRDISILKTKI